MHNTRSRATDKHEIVQSSSATSYYFFLLLFSVFLYIVISFAAGWLVEFFDNVVVASRTHSPIYSILSVAENACQNALYMQWPAKPGCTRRASTNSESGLFFCCPFFFYVVLFLFICFLFLFIWKRRKKPDDDVHLYVHTTTFSYSSLQNWWLQKRLCLVLCTAYECAMKT